MKKEKISKFTIEFLSTAGTIIVAMFAAFIPAVIVGGAVVGHVYTYSTVIAGDNWRYIFWVTLFFTPVLTKYFYMKINKK